MSSSVIGTTSSFSFREVTGQKRILHLAGRALPKRPFVTMVRQRNDYTLLPGYSRASLTLLGPEDAPVRINGFWKDMYISPSQSAALEGHYLQQATQAVERGSQAVADAIGFGTPSQSTTNVVVPVLFNGVRVNSARETVAIFETWCREGRLLEVTWDAFAWHGIIEEFQTSWHNVHDVEWEIGFKWLGRAEPSFAPLLADEHGVAETASWFQKLSDTLGLEALPPTFPMASDIFADMNALILRVASTTQAISDTIKGMADRVVMPVQAARKLISLFTTIAAQAVDLKQFLKQTFVPGNQYPRQLGLSVSAGQLASTDPKVGEAIVARSFSERMIVSEYTTRVAAVAQQIEVEAVARARAYADTLTGELTSVHVVRRGEDLRDLSQAAYNTPNEWRQIMSYNQLATPELTPGQVILIPRTSLQEEC